MEPERQDGESLDPPVLTRAALRERLEARLEARLNDAALAAWAFNQFYAEDMGELDLEPGAEEVLRDVLDELMFADDDAFALDTSALNALIARLQL